MKKALIICLILGLFLISFVSAKPQEICITDGLGYRCWDLRVDFYKEFFDGNGKLHQNYKQIAEYRQYGFDDVVDRGGLYLDNFNSLNEFENSIYNGGLMGEEKMCIQKFKGDELKFDKC